MGTEGYAEQNQTYGLATIQKRHVRLDSDLITFDYAAKSGKRRLALVLDPVVSEVVAQLKRRGGGPDLLAYKRGGAWVDVRSEDINAYIKEQTGGDFTAKDFRTWSATVPAAVAWPARSPRPGPGRPGPGRSARRSRRSPTTWATPRRCAGPPTSIRGCSTATIPA